MKILVIENEPLKVMGLKSILNEVSPSSHITISDQLETGLELLEKTKINLLVIGTDFATKANLPKINVVSKTHIGMPILIIIEDQKKDHLVTYLKAGIHGILSQKASIEEFKQAIGMILNNKKYVSDDFREVMMKNLIRTSDSSSRKNNELSKREKQIMELLVAKKQYREIAEQLNIKETTIVTYKNRILSKLNISSFNDISRNA